MVGRANELDQLGRFLAAIPGGLGSCVLTGPAGMGKTTVWQRGVELARQAGVTVLRSRPGATETRLSYSGLSDLLGTVEAMRFESLPRVQRHALDVALLRKEAREGGADARVVASSLLSLLRDLSADQPVLVAVDDAQWLDAATASALSYALRRLEEAAVRVLGSVRVDDVFPRTFLAAVPAARTLELPLPPLSVGSIHAIVRQELSWAPPRPTLVKVTAASAGNPFYALEIARQLQRLGGSVPAEGLPVPADHRALVRRRLERLPSETRNALLVAACLAVPRVTLVDEEALAPAEEAGIVRVAETGRIEFTHPLFASAIRDSASIARRRAAHRHLAGLVSGFEERGRHLALAASGPDAEVAGVLDAAAVRAGARGAPEEAAELAELALRLTPDDHPGRPERLLAAAGLQFDAGALERAQTLLEQIVEEARPGPLRVKGLRLLGLLRGRRGGFGEAVQLALAARDAAGAEGALVAEIELDLAVYHAWSDDYAQADAHARAAVPYAESAGLEGLLANALAVQTVLAFLCGRGLAEDDLRRALMLEDPLREAPLLVRPRFVQSLVSLCTGRLEEAIAAFASLRDEAVEQGKESDAPLLYLYLVWASVWHGDPDGAARFAEEARQAAALLDDRLVNALALSAGALAHAYAGLVDESRREAAAAIEQFETLQSWVPTIWPRWARGFLELSLGNAAGAHDALQPLTTLVPALGSSDVALSLFVPDEVEALIGLGRNAEARTLLEPFERRAKAINRDWAVAASARCRAQLCAASGDLEGALASLEESVSLYRAQTFPLEHARTLLQLGRLQRRRKQKRLARLALEEALAMFEALHSPLWVEQTRAELERVVTRNAAAGLTATEERIARLAADGLSNRTIAGQTFVSVKTVESNLKRVYRKLGIGSRAQLSRALDGQSTDTSH